MFMLSDGAQYISSPISDDVTRVQAKTVLQEGLSYKEARYYHKEASPIVNEKKSQ